MPEDGKNMASGSMADPRSTLAKPLVNLQLYQPPMPPRPQFSPFAQVTQSRIDPAMFLAAPAANPFYPPQFSYGLPPYMQPVPQQNPYAIIKNYSINATGPMDNHSRVSLLYEDVLPVKNFNFTSSTLADRLVLYDFLRNTMFSNNDGSDIGLDNEENSLLQKLKFMDLNPYNTFIHSNNPYRGLPENFLIYRSCYPIRRDNFSGGTGCARNSTGMNIRIYKITGPDTTSKEWRDINYYKYIRDNIIKPKKCPNLLNLFGYYISKNSKIDFNKLESVRQGDPLSKTATTQVVRHNAIPNPTGPGLVDNVLNNKNITNMINKNYVLENLSQSVNPAIVALTEGPTYNFLGWACKTYQVEGASRRMTNTGFHNDDEWKSVMFQMMAALYALQKNKIFIENYSVYDNIFIKDVPVNGPITNYWKYKVDGVDFYVPNQGHLVLLDSSFKGEIKGEFAGDRETVPDMFINEVHNMFKNTFDPNIFGVDFKTLGGCVPSAEVQQLFTTINNTSGITNISDYMIKTMHFFLHNRIGTYLKDNEVQYVRRDDSTQPVKGQMMVHEVAADTYKFVMFLNQNGTTANIITKQKHDVIDKMESNIPISSLLTYSKVESIQQNMKAGQTSLNEEELLETYIL